MFSCGSVVPSPATLWYHISLHRAPHLCIVDHRYSRRWSVKHLVIAAHTLLRRRRQVGWDVRFHVSISNMKEWNECVFAVPARSSSCLLNWFIPIHPKFTRSSTNDSIHGNEYRREIHRKYSNLLKGGKARGTNYLLSKVVSNISH